MIQNNNNEEVSVGEWVGMLFLSIIPFVSIITLLILAFSGNTNRNLANWAKAKLIFTGFLFVLFIMLVMIIR